MIETWTKSGQESCVRLTGAPLADLKARALEITTERQDMMTTYYSRKIDGVAEIQVAFTGEEE